VTEFLAGLFTLVLVLSLGLHIFSLPANWLALVLVAIWKFTHPDMPMSWLFFAGLAGLAAVAEGLEFFIQLKGAKKYGATGKGNLGGIIGAIAGAILGAPFGFGLGALPGALLGAYVGCLVFERFQDRPWDEARRAAMGAMWGKFFGMSVKFGFGVVMVMLALQKVWAL